MNEQDTISDESGYSEESTSTPSAKEPQEDIDLEEDFDLTVKGVLISDFSPSERLKYLQRSQSTASRGGGHQSQLQRPSLQPPQPPHQPQPLKPPSHELFQNKV